MDERKLIYADDAIRWIKIECNPYGKPTLDFESGKKVIEYLERLPSAQPEHLVKESDNLVNGLVNDCISRQAAIDAIKTWGLIDGLSEGQAIEILADEEKLPSAQPEIIRCKDCKKWHTNCRPVCGKHGCDVISDYTKPDDFCSWAERRTDE